MIAIRTLNILAALVALCAGTVGAVRHHAATSRPVHADLAVLGQREASPGLWEGVDLTLGEHAVAPGLDLKVGMAVTEPAFAHLIAVEEDGTGRSLGPAARLLPGREYVWPEPGRSYRLGPEPPSLVVLLSREPLVAPPGGADVLALAHRLAEDTKAEAGGRWAFRTRDGAAASAAAVRLSGRGGLAAWVLRLRDGGHATLPEPLSPVPSGAGTALLAAP